MPEISTDLPRVLVVDDNQDAAISLALLLGAAGYQVETSFDGKAALEAAERFGPDACVLDINITPALI
jgi:DNA-binding response OmpR family regulator